MSISELRTIYRAAAGELDDALRLVRPHIDEVMPGGRFDRRSMARELDRVLGEAAGHVEEAQRHLGRIPTSAECLVSESVERVKTSVQELHDAMVARRATLDAKPPRGQRFFRLGGIPEFDQLTAGIQAVGEDRAAPAVASLIERTQLHESHLRSRRAEAHYLEFGTRDERLLARTINGLDPVLGPRVDPWIPRHPYKALGLERFVETFVNPTNGVEYVAREKLMSVQARASMNDATPIQFAAGDLRRMVDAAAPPDATWRPSWLKNASDTTQIVLGADEAADIEFAVRSTSKDALEGLFADVGARLTSKQKSQYDSFFEAILSARTRLPEELRPDVPAGIGVDRAVTSAWAREVRTRDVRAAIEGRPRDLALVRDLLVSAPTGGGAGVDRGATRGAHIIAGEILDSLEPAADDATRKLRSELRAQLAKLEADQTGLLDYSLHGQARANAELLATLAADAGPVADPVALTW